MEEDLMTLLWPNTMWFNNPWMRNALWRANWFENCCEELGVQSSENLKLLFFSRLNFITRKGQIQ